MDTAEEFEQHVRVSHSSSLSRLARRVLRL